MRWLKFKNLNLPTDDNFLTSLKSTQTDQSQHTAT
jgi:hypothetical protein